MDQGTARERRRCLIEMTLRRARPGTGSSMEFYRRRDWSALGVDLSSIKTPFAIVGAIATRLYMPERATHDIDLFVHADDRHALAGELVEHGFSKHGELSIGGSTWIGADGQQLYIIESNDLWARDAIVSASRAPDGSPVIGLPYLLLLKLRASRFQDTADVSKMLGLASEETLDQVREVIATYQPEDREDLESLITLGKIEFGVDDASVH
jgi:hypothetical protein